MATASILGGDFDVYFTDHGVGGDKQIIWGGSATGTRTANELYSALQDLFDNDTAGVGDYMDEGTPMSAQTPSDYRIGRLETNDPEPWFIDPESITHITDGAITTVGWTRTTGTDTGIVRVSVTGGFSIIAADVGDSVTHASGDSGTLLAVDSTNNYLWIRPDDELAANNFDSTGTITADTSSRTASQSVATPDTGEWIWSNIYTIGNIEDFTNIHVAQDNTVLTDWWPYGHIDTLFYTTEMDTVIDSGELSVYARKPNTLYSYAVTTADGGRTPVALATSPDVNDPDGAWSVSVASAGGVFTIGELVTSSNGALAVVTANTGSPTTAFEYSLVGDGITNIANGNTLTGSIVGANGTAGTPSAANASTYTGITVTFGWDNTFDIDGDLTNEDYSIVIDGNGRPLTEIYERLKYITRRGATATLNGIQGQQYIGTSNRVDYDSITGAITTGATVTQVITGGTVTAEVVGHNTTDDYLMLRDVRGGVFEVGAGAANIEVDGSNYVVVSTAGVSEIISPVQPCPFGTIAGGRFFGARGVVLDNIAGADLNNYELIDDDGILRAQPVQYTLALTDIISGTEIRVYEDSAGSAGTALAGEENNTTGTFEYTYPSADAGNDVIIVIAHLDYKIQRLFLTLSASSQSIPIAQEVDRVYRNP